ncbi:hypothetical protein [Dysosmobacter sp.]|uniref:hypothetical protein n=1 Tax=Dysosmobacter sp. TaxID=2591382 RepID=UPI002A86744E|nr:hypothetical protein [Dysosmobacter sp.]MDY3984595.1 hypothetical protein [Dysosmobacter sp.]
MVRIFKNIGPPHKIVQAYFGPMPPELYQKQPENRLLRLLKKSDGLFRRLHNTSIFWPLCCPKICRCAAQTPAGAGFLQAFDSTRRGSRPLVLPLQNATQLL